MVLVTSNPAKKLLLIAYIGRVVPAEIRRGYDDARILFETLKPGYRLLVDLSQLATMEMACVPEIGRLMELISQAGAELVVRVIPDPDKDIGMNIMAAFHYAHSLRTVTCVNLPEAGRVLAL